MKHTNFIMKVLIAVILILPHPKETVNAQDDPPEFVRNAVSAVEKMLDSDDDQSIKDFIKTNLTSRSENENFFEKMKAIRDETKGLRDAIYVEGEPDGVSLFLSSGDVTKRVKIELGPNGISDLKLAKTAEPILLTKDNLREVFDNIEKEGMSGVIYIKKDGKVLVKRGFGFANKELKTLNTSNTIFGTGSRPIDYTVAAIYLLTQQNKIDLDDSIDKYFSSVPEDKKAITIRHLLTGQSGLPDFFDNENDWDPDLAWVDRQTAERRLFAQDLLFTPGEDQRHSHGAFGLLAALVEHVSGTDYYSFIKANFLDPAGMNHTGEYGETLGFSVEQFAEGDGPQHVGLPNIPPNWGPTSWLIKGSGGMVSTLNDLLKFYEYIRSGKVLDENHNQVFSQASVNLDGSDRGFELFSAYFPPDNEVYLFINSKNDREKMRQLFIALEKYVDPKRQM